MPEAGSGILSSKDHQCWGVGMLWLQYRLWIWQNWYLGWFFSILIFYNPQLLYARKTGIIPHLLLPNRIHLSPNSKGHFVMREKAGYWFPVSPMPAVLQLISLCLVMPLKRPRAWKQQVEATSAMGVAWMSHTVEHSVTPWRERLMLLCVAHTDIIYLPGPAKWGVGDNCKLITLLCSQIDEDKRRDTTQRLRQGKYDKKVTWLQCTYSLPWLRWALLGGGCSSPQTIPPLLTLQNYLTLWKEQAIYSLSGALHFAYWLEVKY